MCTGFINESHDNYYYCSDKCLESSYTVSELVELKDVGQIYWTDWGDGDDEKNHFDERTR